MQQLVHDMSPNTGDGSFESFPACKWQGRETFERVHTVVPHCVGISFLHGMYSCVTSLIIVACIGHVKIQPVLH